MSRDFDASIPLFIIWDLRRNSVIWPVLAFFAGPARFPLNINNIDLRMSHTLCMYSTSSTLTLSFWVIVISNFPLFYFQRETGSNNLFIIVIYTNICHSVLDEKPPLFPLLVIMDSTCDIAKEYLFRLLGMISSTPNYISHENNQIMHLASGGVFIIQLWIIDRAKLLIGELLINCWDGKR